MRRHVWGILLSLAALQAQDISGSWQGSLGESTDKIRLMLRMAKGPGVPSARVVRLPNADHYVFRSNDADVLREINTFLQGLPRK